MKKLITASAILASSLLTIPAIANNVGVWNSQMAISNSNFAKSKIASIEATIKPKQQQLQTYQANVDRLQQQFETQQAKLSDVQKQDIARQIQSNLQSYESVANQIQMTLSRSEEEVLKKVSPVIKSITDGIIRQKNIDVLIDSRDRNITFVKPEWDITNEVTQKLNEQVR